MINIEQNLKDICRQKGLTLSDVAFRIGTNPSNLLSSIKGNPTIARLQNIADAINISPAELLTNRPEHAQGIAIIGGQVYQLTRPAPSTIQLPYFDRFDTLRKEVAAFIKKAVKSSELISKVGLLETTEVFTLIYDPHEAKFYLSLCFCDGEIATFAYDKLEFAKWPDDHKTDEPDWDVPSVIEEILGDIESAAPVQQK